MTEHHRKIELQSPDDLQFLISNVRRAANEKIDKDLPPIEGEDKMRRRVEELVHDYITTVFSNCSDSITINGLEPSPELLKSLLSDTATEGRRIEEHEPFNSKLWERAKELARQEEDLIEEIAALRRTMPGFAVEGVKRSYKEAMESDDAEVKRMGDGIREREAKETELGLVEFERQAELEGAWKKGVDGLGRLKRTMPEMVAKKERAERAEDYIRRSEK